MPSVRAAFTAATAVAVAIWALYAFFIGRIGGRAFEDSPWAGLVIAFGASIAISAVVEVIRRLRARGLVSGRYTGPDHAGQEQGDRDEPHSRDRAAEEDHVGRRHPCASTPGPDRAGGPTNAEMEDSTGQRLSDSRRDIWGATSVRRRPACKISSAADLVNGTHVPGY